MRFILSDEQWLRIEQLMPQRRLVDRTDDRKVISAILYVLVTGIPWRDLPVSLGPYTTAYNRYNRWSRRGLWQKIASELGLPIISRVARGCAGNTPGKAVPRNRLGQPAVPHLQSLTI